MCSHWSKLEDEILKPSVTKDEYRFFFSPKIISCEPVPGLRCMGSDVFCLMEKHFLCFVEAAYIPSAALELFVTAFLTPGAGQAGPLALIWRWTVLKREVKRGSLAFKKGLGYFKHNTSFKVKRLSCNTLQRKRSSYFRTAPVSLKVFPRQRKHLGSAVRNALLSKSAKLKRLKA